MLNTCDERLKYISLMLILLLSSQCLDAKRIYSSGSSRRSSSASSSNVRRTSASSKPSYSHSDLTRLSYGSNHATAPKSTSSNTHGSTSHGSQPAPAIGWNVPQKQGPPPAYSASNPVGGAKTNIHESAPAYKPAQTYNSNPPSYSQATNTHGNTGGTAYRPRMNSTGGFGGGYHAPIAATNYQGVQSSNNYNRQQVPAGATYYPGGSSGVPAGATYYPSGGLPAGASYHPQGGIPAGASYYPAGGLPAGASYHPQGGIPAGASYYPQGPAAYPAGATYLPAGAALPAGATYMSSPPRSSSGLGFGSGLLAGGLAGGILGHVLTPSGTRVEHVAAPAASSGGDDGKIIIINNGPPGSVTTTDVGHGTTVINAGGAAQPAAPPAVAPNAAAPAPADTPVNLAPMNAPVADSNSGVGVGAAAATGGLAAAAEMTPAPVPASDAQATPAPGGIICVNVKVLEPDATDSTKTVEVDKIACYPAQAQEQPAPAVPETITGAPTTDTTAVTTLPDGVPLAPLNPASQADIMKMPGTPAAFSEQSGIKVASSADMPFHSILFSTLLTTLVAYCLH